MPFEILEANDRMEIGPMCVAILGLGSQGKTTLALTAPDVFFVDFQRGTGKVTNRQQEGTSVVLAERATWRELEGVLTEDRLRSYKTVVFDPAGHLVEMMRIGMVTENPGLRNGDTGMTPQGWGALSARFRRLIDDLTAWGKDVIFVCTAREVERKEETVIRMRMAGGSREVLMEEARIIGYLKAYSPTNRVLHLAPHKDYPVKSVAGFGDVIVPDTAVAPNFIGNLIDDVRKRMQELNESQSAAAAQDAGLLEAARVQAAAGDTGSALALYSSHARELTERYRARQRDGAPTEELTALRSRMDAVSSGAGELGARWDKELSSFVTGTETEVVTPLGAGEAEVGHDFAEGSLDLDEGGAEGAPSLAAALGGAGS